MSSKPETTLAGMQSRVHSWISQWDVGYFHPLSNLARLMEEVGELARHVNVLHGDKPPKPGAVSAEKDGVAEELGDVLFLVATLANQLDVDLEQAFDATLAKYDARDAERLRGL